MTRSTDIQHDIRLVDYRVAILDCRTDLYLRFVGKAGFNTGPRVRYSCGQLLDVGRNQRNAPSPACRSRSKPTRLILAQMSWSRVTPWHGVGQRDSPRFVASARIAAKRALSFGHVAPVRRLVNAPRCK
jgi:hypothetical protein